MFKVDPKSGAYELVNVSVYGDCNISANDFEIGDEHPFFIDNVTSTIYNVDVILFTGEGANDAQKITISMFPGRSPYILRKCFSNALIPNGSLKYFR